jgi:hypothetical protein
LAADSAWLERVGGSRKIRDESEKRVRSMRKATVPEAVLTAGQCGDPEARCGIAFALE